MILRIIFFLTCSISAHAISAHINEKYSYTLVTDDYGILNEDDLAAYSEYRQKKVPFSGSAEEFSARYWQCFPREEISLTFVDMGHSSDGEIDDDTLADLKITAYVRPGVFHEYGMRKLMPADEYEKRLQLWRTLLKNEAYVCLGGEFSGRGERIREYGSKQEAYTWTFDRIKTKKGCDGYFGCGNLN